MRSTHEDSSEARNERNREFMAVALRHRQSKAWMSPWYSVDRPWVDDREGHTTGSTRLRGAGHELLKLDALERVLVSQFEDLRRSGSGGSGSGSQPGGPPVATDRSARAIIDRILRIMARRAALLGLDAPRMREVSVISERQLEDSIADLKAEVQALEAAEAARDTADSQDRAQPA